MNKWKSYAIAAIAALCFAGAPLAAHATDDAGDYADALDDSDYLTGDSNDPFETYNRAVFAFNRTLDGVLIKPMALMYRAAVPQPARDGVGNVLENLTSPVVSANAFLQRDPYHGFVMLWRFILNSTLGIGGIFDFADTVGLHYRYEDFGQTLGAAGMGAGPYIVLPIVGPSSARDMFGGLVDVAMDPFTYILDDDARTVRYGVTVVDAREDTLEMMDDAERNSIDLYATVRSAYQQYREKQINNRSDN
ncbi:MAG: VacJ family lipoprotein [Alphaproteobacteria bacterium]|nr:VacJ family lipoprotein [Alphaproteobacteria bacterium]